MNSTKVANENARYVLPNASETKIIVTMNVRSLYNFFSKRCCERAQWEIRELANEIGVDESLVSRYIHKQYIPNLKTIIKIAYVLNCDISELVDFGETIE